MPNRNEYTVGWICATHTENVAAQVFLDEKHAGPESVQRNDDNIYTLGRMGKHNVVIAALPHQQYGLVNAASVARNMVHSFPNVRIGLLVGVGGGVPSSIHDIRLGDVVVSSPDPGSGGVFQHDYGKKKQDEDFTTTGFLNQPPMILLKAIQKLRAEHEIEGHQIQEAIEAIFQKYKKLRAKYNQPDRSTDRLYKSSFTHKGSDSDSCTVVCGDDRDNLRSRTKRAEDEDDPIIHYGLIASGNQVLKDAEYRDKLALEKEILCFEMEAAGLMNHFPCLVIRGISDYCDTHKSKQWQGYASMTAAAYAKELLNIIAPNNIEAEAPLIQSMAQACLKDVSVIKGVMTQVGANQVSEIERKILDWITNITYGNEHSDIRNKRLPETSEWFLKTKEYHDWINNSGKTLYCEGMPGAGKTIIASVIVDDLDRSQKENGIAYVYCNYKRGEIQTVESLLKTMLRQLLQTRLPLPEPVKSLYDEQESRQTRLTLEETRGLLRSTVASYPRVFIVIDALDECIGPDDCRSRYLQEIQELQVFYAVNVLATSRPLPEVRKMPPFKDSTLVRLQGHDEDIQKYLDDRVSRLSSFVQQDIGLQLTIKGRIQKIVNGINYNHAEAHCSRFLLAKLYMDMIEDKMTSNGIKKATNAFGTNPDAYSEAYEAAIERIESQKGDRLKYAKKLLSWVSLAKRELSVSELRHALAVKPDARDLDKDDIPDLQDVVSFCAGLVDIDQTSQVVRLVHLTAQTFLDHKLSKISPNAESSVARVCITYLCFDNYAWHNATRGEVTVHIRNYPLFNYAARYWGQHTQNSRQFKDALRLLQRTANVQFSFQTLSMDSRLEIYRSVQKYRDPERDIVALHLIAYLGLDELVGEVIAEAEIDAKTNSRWTPLWIAAAQGHEAVARLLIGYGATIDADSNGKTPLFAAASEGHEAVAKVLIEHGATIDADSNGKTPLFAAASEGHEAVVRLLIEHGATINTRGLTWPPVVGAAEKGHEALVRLLIEHGANINADLIDKTPLFAAASEGHEAVVRLLIDHGATINPRGNIWPPVVGAAKKGHEALVRLLIDHGADVNLGAKCGTPLTGAARGGYDAIMSLLIEHGADVDQKDSDGETPLNIAAGRGDEGVVKLLLENGASINKAGYKKKTPLIRASSHEVAELLVKNGADTNACDRDGETPLGCAARRGDEATVKLLIDHGASVSKAEKHETPLICAASRGDEAIVQLLIDHGASIDKAKKNGETPLICAASIGHEAIVKLLIDHGASINKTEKYGRTPRAAAMYYGHKAVERLLFKHGATLQSS
ncbi:unnamed protein product [Clonostachys byssicola]|uniref:Uncharacterized protein n=1 Tax=Clonostachys byssicola TaxID=160290 RepID=A0A9N9UU51_9HYPO|nr:unnamed protein product [Clonostachys byssicola]